MQADEGDSLPGVEVSQRQTRKSVRKRTEANQSDSSVASLTKLMAERRSVIAEPEAVAVGSLTMTSIGATAQQCLE